jgi:transglutaminase-like putative cysteine protease
MSPTPRTLLDRPRGAPQTAGVPAGRGGPHPSGPPRPVSAAWSIYAEVALASVTAAATIGFVRVFSDRSFIVPVLIGVVFAHSVASAGRHLSLPPVLAGLVSALSVLLVTAWVVEPGTTTLGLPLTATWKALGADLHDAWQRFNEVKAPTAVTPGFLAAAVCGAALAGAVADGLAFRTRARFEALAPSFTLFMFGALLGADSYRLLASAVYLAAVLVFVVVSSPATRDGQAWFGDRARAGESALLRGGIAVAAGALALGLAVGPQLPGAHAAGLVGVHKTSSKGSGSRVTVSPLVDIRNRLVDQSSTEMFTVRSAAPSYWRLTSLGRFDGNIWSSVGSYQPASGGLGSTQGPVKSDVVQQRFAIANLQSIWLPAAYRATRLDGASGVRFDADSSSLLTDADTSDGLSYTVESAVPRPTAPDLEAVRPGVPGDIANQYLELPSDFPTRVRQLAAQLTDAQPRPYDKAKALQDWFRSNFTYDLNVPAGHDNSAIERFLFVTKRGYCEQFAGSYAAMARAIGLPARVGVGFTTGTDAGDGTFHVAGKDAHAWPEVYLGQLGWVPFEPTPGRAIPAAESYTGVATPSPQPTPSTTPATPSTTAVAGAPPSTPSTVMPTTTAPTTSPRARHTSGGGFPVRWLLLVLGIAALAAYAFGVPAARRARRRQRRAAASSPTAQVLLAWDEANDDLALAGVRRVPSETAAEFARRASLGAPGPAAPDGEATREAMTLLAERWATATWSPEGATDEEAAGAAEAAARVHAAVVARTSSVRRWLRDLDPRPLLRPATA